MTTPMLSNYYTLHWLTVGIDSRLRGKRIAGVFTQHKDELVIGFEGESSALVFSCRPHAGSLYLHPDYARAKRNTANVLPGVVGTTLLSATIHPSDRVVRLRLDDGCSLYAQFFGLMSNVLLVDEKMNVLSSFHDAARHAGKSYQPKPEEPLITDLTLIDESILSHPQSPIGGLIKSAYPTLGPTLIKELLHRAGITSSQKAGELPPEKIEQLKSSLLHLHREIASPVPLVYVEAGKDDQSVALSIVPLHHLPDTEPKQFDDLHQAVRFFLSRQSATQRLNVGVGGVIGPLRSQVERARRTVTALEKESDNVPREGEYERSGKLLLSHLSEITKGQGSIRLSDGDGELTIKLDVRLAPTENAQRFFEKAKSARVARKQSVARLEEQRTKIASAETLLAKLDGLHTQEELKAFMEEHQGELEEFGLDVKGKEREQLPFRVFTVDGGFEVWAGKSSQNNDLLTVRHAKPNDLWFHARGSSGSHVVLKVGTGKGEPSKKAKEQTAAIAAYYSKMRNAKMVPVAMTEKKYVRKPKGAPPGTVVIEREKVIFAEPALPGEET
ncbi:MAG: NFACT family protein [Bacteroidota bacterium]